MNTGLKQTSVILPTRQRPDFLDRCLRSLAQQSEPIHEILVAVSPDDGESIHMIESWKPSLPVRQVIATGRGVVGAMNACLDVSSGDTVLLLDDDVELPADWLRGMKVHLLADSCVAGAGGRDLLQDHPELRKSEPLLAHVGIVEPWGRMVGNHHRGAPPARPVRFLRGSNCLYRGDFLRAVRFDERLRGAGAQVHWELSLGFAAWQAGLRLIYDPTWCVLHHVAPRHDGDGNHRGIFDANGVYDMTYNEVLILMMDAPKGVRARCLAWNFFVGSVTCPGLFQIPRLVLKREAFLGARIQAAWRGRIDALRAARKLRRSNK